MPKRLMFAFFLIALFQFQNTRWANAQEVFQDNYITSFKMVADGGELQPQQLYLVEILCKQKNGDIPKDNRLFRRFGFSTTVYTANHLIIITSARVGAAPAAGDKLPDDALAISYPYTVKPSGGYRDPTCQNTPQLHVVQGGEQNLTINATINFTKEHQVNPIIPIILNSLKLASPLLRIFDAPEGADLAKKYLGKAEDAKTPFSELLTSLNSGTSKVLPLKLRVGKYTIRTPYGDEFITVKPIVSLVKSKYPFSYYLPKQLKANSLTLSATNLKADCLGLYGSLTNLGFRSPLDRGYATLQLAISAKLEKDDIIDCLSREDALAVARDLPSRLWDNAEPEKQRFSPDDVMARKPEVSSIVIPPYTIKMQDDLDKIVTFLSKSGRNTKDADRINAAPIQYFFSDSIEIDDRTTDDVLSNKNSASISEIASILRTKGITRFGCYDNAQLAAHYTGDAAIATFLAFRVAGDAKSATANDAYVFRVFYDPKKINKVKISKDVGQIHALLEKRTGCGELTIKPPQA